MARWHVELENKSPQRRSARMRDAQSRERGVRGIGGSAVGKSEEMADRVVVMCRYSK